MVSKPKKHVKPKPAAAKLRRGTLQDMKDQKKDRRLKPPGAD